MFIDALGLVADAQAFTGAATLSVGSIDLGNVTPKREIGSGEPIGFAFSIDVAAGAGSTVLLEVVQATTADLGTSLDVIATLSLAAADVTAGKLFFLAIPPGFPTKRFIGIRETSSSGTTTVTLTSWLTAQSLFAVLAKSYAKGYVS